MTKVVVKKNRPPEGIHPVIGYCKIGQAFDVSEADAKAMIAGGEFEAVNPASIESDAAGPVAEKPADAADSVAPSDVPAAPSVPGRRRGRA